MNPKTLLTTDQIINICNRHNIIYKNHTRITIGFSHEVHKLNNNTIIKLYKLGESIKYYQTELALLGSNLNFPKAKLIACYESKNKNERNYIIMSYVDGVSLGGVWHLANNTQREKIVKDVSKALKIINTLDPALIDSSHAPLSKRIETKLTNLAEKLSSNKTISAQTANKIVQKAKDTKLYFNDTKLFPVYYDIHFDNFIVNQNFNLQAIIDLENVEIAALDYPLFCLRKMTDEPHKYLSEQDEQFANKKDYINLIPWYKKYYPEMFAYKYPAQRLEFYQLIDTLNLLIDWPNDKTLYGKLELLIND